MNVPNSLTLARILLAPVLALAMQPSVDASVAAAVFAAGMASDAIDGHLARARGLVTRFGTLMDPIADKLFIGTALIGLLATDRIAAWVVLVIVARELLVTALRLVARRQGVIIAANGLGKAKTLLQAIVVFALLTVDAGSVTDGLVILMVAITVLSGVVYGGGYLRGRRVAILRVTSAPEVAGSDPAGYSSAAATRDSGATGTPASHGMS